jgi:hypothetical protein
MMVQLASYNRSVDLAAMPDRIRRLPISPTGFPVPWFIVWFKDGKPCAVGDGEPDFRVSNEEKVYRAVREKRCWICSELLGVYKTWCIGSMCVINRCISEPCAHKECSIFSARFCPFLSRPRMSRNEREIPTGMKDPAGFGFRRNPGTVAVWITKSFKVFRAQAGERGLLFSLGPPEEVLWFCEGRPARRSEVMASIESGYPLLEKMAREGEPGDLAVLQTQYDVAMQLIPAS